MNEESLFAAALDIATDAERQAFLDEACAGDVGLRQRVEKLLAADGHARGLLDDTKLGGPRYWPPPPEHPAPAAGRVIAERFRLREKVGEGGMGEVWVADQLAPVKRQVAVKLIRDSFASGQLLIRFERERQALALMNHPNVAKVLDAGVDHGQPFFVMEFIDGVPFTRYCDEAKLSVRERVELFVPVCQAVQHAHTKGIIHRDLKPSNILVSVCDGQAVPKVIDFGLAKAVGPRLSEDSASTEIGTLLGTLEYMSPEQADPLTLDVDTRSDTYSLGVVLYELLTGQVPFPRAQLHAVSLVAMLGIIKEVEPPRPSDRLSAVERLAEVAMARRADPKKLKAQVQGELDWIVMKCLEKDPARRYETASGLAMDLGRFLANEPVLAGPPKAGYRLRKYARKYRKVLATAAAFVVLLVAATVSSLALASWALRERSHADEQKRAAEENLRSAFEAVNFLLTRVGYGRLEHVPQMEPIRRELLQEALRFYQQFLQARGHDRTMRLQVGRAHWHLGEIQAQLGQREEAEAAFLEASVQLEQMLSESPEDLVLRNDLGNVYNNLGLIYQINGRLAQAEAALLRTVALLEPQGAKGPQELKNRHDQAATWSNLVGLYRQKGELEKAEAAFQKSKAISEAVLARDPKKVASMALLAAGHQNVALVYRGLGKAREMESANQIAIDYYRKLILAEPEDVTHRKGLAQTLNNLGLLYSQIGQDDKADAAYKESLGLMKAIHEDHPKVVVYQLDLAGSYSNMATHVRRTRSAEESLSWTARAIDVVERLLQREPGDVHARMVLFDTLMGRGYAWVRLDRREDAVKDWKRMIEISEGQGHVNMRLFRPFALAFLGEHARAAGETEALVAEGQVHGRSLWLFACVQSLCSGAAREDVRLPLPVREKLADRYGGRAVALLRGAQATGYFRDPNLAARLKESRDLRAIGSRADFQQLVKDVATGR